MRLALLLVSAVAVLGSGLVTAPALAQVPAQASEREAQIAAQASFDTGYLLAQYMAQLAAAGQPPSQADLEEAVHQYFSNGAALTSVPSGGPGAAYFQNGAEVTAMPASGPAAEYFHNGAEVTAYYSSARTPAPEAPRAPPEESAAVDASTLVAAAVRETPEPTPIAPLGSLHGPELEVSKRTPSSELTCRPAEIEAAMAIARQFAAASAPEAPASPSCEPAVVPTPVPARAAPPPATPAVVSPERSEVCPPATSLFSEVARVLGGALLGGLAIALWDRPRPARVSRRRPRRGVA